MFEFFKNIKKINELERQLYFYKEKTQRLNNELSEIKSSNYKYRRLFSKIFTRNAISNVEKYEVYNSLTDGQVLIDIYFDDKTNSRYKVELLGAGYKEDLTDGSNE